jgi:hypothetical protein
MEHRTSAEIEGFAAVIRPQKLSKKELLERWALALERHCHVNRKFAGQMTTAATVHAATVAWRQVSIA